MDEDRVRTGRRGGSHRSFRVGTPVAFEEEMRSTFLWSRDPRRRSHAAQDERRREASTVLDNADACIVGTDEAASLEECQRVRGMIAFDEGDGHCSWIGYGRNAKSGGALLLAFAQLQHWTLAPRAGMGQRDVTKS
jgi:hypothetical protein